MRGHLERQHAVEQFYYREARLLDSRQYLQWLALVTEDIRYVMPSRVNNLVDNRMRGQEDMISVERELEGSDSLGAPIRDESYAHLFVRVDRAYKVNSWAENPPARTRRIIGNVEILEHNDRCYTVSSNFHLFFARPGSENFMYSGQRNDVLIVDGNVFKDDFKGDFKDAFKIDKREIIMDYANIDVPTLGLLL